MKIRQGFVSNSSSSSFICDVCGEDVSGWDICFDEVGMRECVKGHIFCDEHMEKEVTLDMDAIRKYLLENADDKEGQERILEMEEDELGAEAIEWDCPLVSLRHECPSAYCPICSFKNAKDWDAYKYFLKKSNLTEEQFLSNLKNEFKDYDEFLEFLKEKD